MERSTPIAAATRRQQRRCPSSAGVPPASLHPERSGNRFLVLTRLGNRRLLVNGEQLAIPHHHSPADHHGLHITRLQCIRDLCVNVIHRHGVRLVETNQNQVRLFSLFERSDFFLHVQRTGAVDGCHFHDSQSIQRQRTHLRNLRQ